MFSRARLIFVVFYLTAILIATVNLRTAGARLFYSYRTVRVTQDRLKQQLWQKQLELESLISPTRIYQETLDSAGGG